MKKIIAIIVSAIIIIVFMFSRNYSICYNETHRNYFTKEGFLIPDTTLSIQDTFIIKKPSSIHLFMESSGSMNGFLRASIPTTFKCDLWEIINKHLNLISEISVMSTDGGVIKTTNLQVEDFQNPLNGGGFISSKSTNICKMLNSVIQNINPDLGEIAIFISDMEYDPIGAVAPKVLESVYSTDIATILSKFGYSLSLIAATSNSVNKDGVTLTENRPYYYLILGKSEYVADVRNSISTILNDNKHFVDNIECGFNYGKVPYSIGKYYGCTQLCSEPSFVSVSDTECSFDLKIELENYRWILADNKNILNEAFTISSINGTKVKVDSISYDKNMAVNKIISHDVTAVMHISISQMPYDCDILKWNINVPYNDISRFQNLFTEIPSSLEQTYSIKEFIAGMFNSSLITKGGKDNFIHISKK